MSKTDTRIVLYPAYFNSSISRQDGRRVSKSCAIAAPTAVKLATACRSLGLTFNLEGNSYSRFPHELGRVKVDITGKYENKSDLLSALGVALVEQESKAAAALVVTNESKKQGK